MDEEALNHSLRKFLKTIGVTAQREIEIAIRKAVDEKRVTGAESLPARATITIAGVDLNLQIDGKIELK
jgi:hypothetical protein